MENVSIDGQEIKGLQNVYFRSLGDVQLNYQDSIKVIIRNPACFKNFNAIFLESDID